MLRLHHVNLGVPEDGLEAQESFLIDVIGLRQMERGVESPPTANWFEADGGVQIHVSRDPNHHAPERAHVAFEFGDDLADLERRLDKAGVDYTVNVNDMGRILICQDPAGNRWELRG
jgi:catechol 2,3-dioxygenase-like lactoylglutathione lyase family enzyme